MVVRERELARHVGGCPVLLSRDPGIAPNSRYAEANGQGTILEACMQQHSTHYYTLCKLN